MSVECSIAYFSMEIALEEIMPTYAGGLGVLAGDTLRAAADLEIPMVGVSLLYRKGYFFQRLDDSGWQTEEPVSWVPEDILCEMNSRVAVSIDGRDVELRAWQYLVQGCGTHQIPVILLDADVSENEPWFRTLTDTLYGGDFYYRICQEIILGIGGVRMLRALGYSELDRFHMNEGHAALLSIELLDEQKRQSKRTQLKDADFEAVRRKCVFTTHTPVEAGHDKFPIDVAARVIGLTQDHLKRENLFCCDDVLNMTLLAMNMSHYINGVGRKHAELSRHMFEGYMIDEITNGVHPTTWTSAPFRALFTKHIPEWEHDTYGLRSVLAIPDSEIWSAHQETKKDLIQFVNRETNGGFDNDYLTLGFARRATPYKRGTLPLNDVQRLNQIASEVGPLQFVYAGKAHPGDDRGKGLIQRVFQARDATGPDVRIVYLENYDMKLAKLLTSGVDVWINTPLPPLEASGTSGMKAAFNGIPSLSVLDGWWIEGWIEGVTGWAIDAGGPLKEGRERWEADANGFNEKLETVVAPMFYRDREKFIGIMRHVIALNASFFNTHRMLRQYVVKAYFL